MMFHKNKDFWVNYVILYKGNRQVQQIFISDVQELSSFIISKRGQSDCTVFSTAHILQQLASPSTLIGIAVTTYKFRTEKSIGAQFAPTQSTWLFQRYIEIYNTCRSPDGKGFTERRITRNPKTFKTTSKAQLIISSNNSRL